MGRRAQGSVVIACWEHPAARGGAGRAPRALPRASEPSQRIASRSASYVPRRPLPDRWRSAARSAPDGARSDFYNAYLPRAELAPRRRASLGTGTHRSHPRPPAAPLGIPNSRRREALLPTRSDRRGGVARRARRRRRQQRLREAGGTALAGRAAPSRAGEWRACRRTRGGATVRSSAAPSVEGGGGARGACQQCRCCWC